MLFWLCYFVVRGILQLATLRCCSVEKLRVIAGLSKT